MSSVAGLDRLESIGEHLLVLSNPILSSWGLPALLELVGEVHINSNPLLPRCEVDAWIESHGLRDHIVNLSGNDEEAVCEE